MKKPADMELFEIITWWSRLNRYTKESLKRSVLFKRHLINEFNQWDKSDYSYLHPNTGLVDDYLDKIDQFFLRFFSNPIFFNRYKSDNIEDDRLFIESLDFGGSDYANEVNETTFSINDEGRYLFLEKLPAGYEIKEDIYFFHEILNLPFFISEGAVNSGNDLLKPLKKLRWIFCNKEFIYFPSKGIFSGLATDQLQGVALIDCRLYKFKELLDQMPNLKHLNISRRFNGNNLHDIEFLQGHRFKTLILRRNSMYAYNALISDTLEYLDCTGSGQISLKRVKELSDAMPNCTIKHNALSEEAKAEAEAKRSGTTYYGMYPTNRDAFDTDEQYYDWLNQ